MKLKELAKLGVTRVQLIENGRPVWNEYSFADMTVFKNGIIGPWLKIYDPCGQSALGRPMWDPIELFTFDLNQGPTPSSNDMCVRESDEFQGYEPPLDLSSKFPGAPRVQTVQPSVEMYLERYSQSNTRAIVVVSHKCLNCGLDTHVPVSMLISDEDKGNTLPLVVQMHEDLHDSSNPRCLLALGRTFLKLEPRLKMLPYDYPLSARPSPLSSEIARILNKRGIK